MKRLIIGSAVVACATFGVHAQEVKKVSRESSVKIKDGDDVKVEIKGLAATSKDAKVEVRTEVKREIENAPDEKLKTKTTIEGDMSDYPLLKVEHVKRISESCPAGS